MVLYELETDSTLPDIALSSLWKLRGWRVWDGHA